MPHPFKENEDVLFGKVGFAGNGTNFDLEHSIWKQYHDSEKNIPNIKRTIISGKEISKENLENLVGEYEKGLNKNSLDKISKDKFNVYARLGAGLSISYLLYFHTPDSIMGGINQFAEFIGDPFITGLARVSLCAIPAVFSVVKNVGIPVVGNLIGAGKKRSKIYRLHNKEKTLQGENKFISLFDSPVKDVVIKDMYEVANNIGTKSNNNNIIKTLRSYIKNIEVDDSPNVDKWKIKFNDLTKSAEQDEQFPWGEIEQLKDMQKNVLGHMENNFRFASLEVITPDSDEQGKEAYIKQAQNLREFLRNPASQKIRKRLYTTYKELKNSDSKEKLLGYMTSLTKDFEKLYGYVARHDFGDSTNQNDRGSLKEFYYHFYVKFGKTTEKLRKEAYKRK
ncbi:hypothetical protein KAR52_02790 [Candidatus Pacearchaeota archaeon]|nr:hypothetical protein [Candidatus Pacearchaeota archaeon]